MGSRRRPRGGASRSGAPSSSGSRRAPPSKAVRPRPSACRIWRTRNTWMLIFPESPSLPESLTPGTASQRVEAKTMTTWIVLALMSLLFLGPLFWRARRDKLEDRALELQADLQAAVNHQLGGESMVAVRVSAGTHSGTGTVELFVPGGWETILEEVWPVVLSRVPAGYMLLFRPPPAVVPGALKRAA